MDRVLGIIGGMGPLATVKLFEKIVLLTDVKCDQEHLHILVDNNTAIPDRTSYLTGTGEDPRRYLIQSARKLSEMGADYLIMPCNTAHYFYNDIIKEIDIPFLNMIEETAKEVKTRYPEIKKIGLLATDGTCRTGVYENIFEKYGIEVIKPSEEKQKFVMNVIYGIKESREFSIEAFLSTIDELMSKGAEVSILGCTELSVLNTLYKLQGKFVDPMDIIARSAIRFGGKKVKEVEL